MRIQNQVESEVRLGDCLEVLQELPSELGDLIYLDPPFFTQREQKLSSRDRTVKFSFDDRWQSASHYASFLYDRLVQMHRVLKPTGSIFFHCDRTASHIARLMLDEVFGENNFRSEIIWSYRRWSNTSQKLLPAHQTILYYSKSNEFKFNTIFTDYSPTTNIDQILQRRSRDESNKSVYARNHEGKVVYAGAKKGVPLSDVWEIPFLNPKAKERTGYPTQKPILLLERIIAIATNEEDLVIDPFCGSGTTLVAANLMGRSAMGVDVSQQAVDLTKKRLLEPVKTISNLLENGLDSYRKSNEEILKFLDGVPYSVVQRNKGIDAILEATFRGVPIPVRVQRPGESIIDASASLYKAAMSKGAARMILVATEESSLLFDIEMPDDVIVIPSASLSIARLLDKWKAEEIAEK